MSGDSNLTLAGGQSPDLTTNFLKAAPMSAGSILNTHAKSSTYKKAMCITQGDSKNYNRTLQLKGSNSRHPGSECHRRTQGSGSSLGMQLSKVLVLLFLLLIATPSSVIAVPVHNCSVARVRHERHLRHGHKNAIKPGSPISLSKLSAASNPDLAGEPTNMLTKAPAESSISMSPAYVTTPTAYINQKPPKRPNTMTDSGPVIFSAFGLTVSTLPISDPIASISTLHPISIPLGPIISVPPGLSLPPLTTITDSSLLGVLFHSSSTTTTPHSTRSSVSTRTPSPTPSTTTHTHQHTSTTPQSIHSPTPTSTPSPTPFTHTDTTTDQHKNMLIIVITLSLILLLTSLIASFFLYRAYSRKRRAQQPRREVELVDILAPRRAQTVRDDLLNRSAGERGSRNSLDDIIAASGRISAIYLGARPESGRAAGTVGGDAREGEDDNEIGKRRRRRRESGKGGKGRGSGDEEEEWETLPPYAY